ncbi:MAG: purine phosphorylase [Gammaproteobacteria bacterium]
MLGIYAALPAEARCLFSHSPARLTSLDYPAALKTRMLMPLGTDTQLWIGGIGPERARAGADQLLQAGARALLSWGCAAGLKPGLNAGDIIIPATVLDTGRQTEFKPDHNWRQRFLQMLLAAPDSISNILQDTLCSSEQVIASSMDKQQLAEQTGASAVDMETVAIAGQAAAAGVPFLCVRVIADTASMQLSPQLLQTLDAFGRPDMRQLAGYLLREPAAAVQLWHLGRSFRRARRQLTRLAQSSDDLFGWQRNSAAGSV